MSERIERWTTRYNHNGALSSITLDSESEADSACECHGMTKIHLVELRNGESIAVNGETDGPPLVSGVDPASGKDGAVVVTMAPWSLVDDARKERDAAIERALTAERRLDAKINELRGLHVEARELRERAEKAELDAAGLRSEFEHMFSPAQMREIKERAEGEMSRALDAINTWKSRALSAESQANDAAAKYERWAAVKFRAVYLASLDGQFDAESEAKNLRSHYFPPAKEASNGHE